MSNGSNASDTPDVGSGTTDIGSGTTGVGTGTAKVEFRCGICDATFSSNTALAAHSLRCAKNLPEE